MDPTTKEQGTPDWMDRVRKGWLRPAASVGAFAAIVAAALRVRPEPPVKASGPPAGFPEPAIEPVQGTPPAPQALARRYRLERVLGGAASPHPFRRSLKDVAVGRKDEVCALGDDEVRVFDSGGSLIRSWKAPGAVCLTVAPDGKHYLGIPGKVQIFSADGIPLGGFDAGEPRAPADITTIRVVDEHVLVGDAFARVIRRYDSSGRQTGEIGTQGKSPKFMLPNRWLEFDVDGEGNIYAADSGRHRVSSWSIDGDPIGRFGKFGHLNAEDFVGCCNPVNLAVGPDGSVITGEKMIARVKAYSEDGRLLALIGPENFDPACTHIHLAVDSKGSIIAADPVRREIKIFSPGA